MPFIFVPQNTANCWYTAKTARLDGKPVEHTQGTTVFPLCHPQFLVNSNSLAQTNFKKSSKLRSSKAAKR
jgi:hypothetical protein